MSLYSRFGFDQKLADQGNWIPVGEGVEFKLRRMNSTFVQEKKKELESPHEALQRSGGEIPEDVMKGILMNLLAQSVILDWRNVTDRDNNVIPFTIEAAKNLLKELPDLIGLLISLSADRDHFKKKQDSAAAGNSGTL